MNILHWCPSKKRKTHPKKQLHPTQPLEGSPMPRSNSTKDTHSMLPMSSFSVPNNRSSSSAASSLLIQALHPFPTQTLPMLERKTPTTKCSLLGEQRQTGLQSTGWWHFDLKPNFIQKHSQRFPLTHGKLCVTGSQSLNRANSSLTSSASTPSSMQFKALMETKRHKPSCLPSA